MPLQPGTRIGPYEILSALGAGGMGEVYRARDPNLRRDVAVKVLPDLVAADPVLLSRFEREVRALAALNHPNIAQIYGVERTGATPAFAMELVVGDTLGDRIARGPLAVAEALPIARQIAEALEAAHEAGIIHRDLKPANIKVRPDGTVKVLDFGLAKGLEAEPEPGPAGTVTSLRTVGSPGAATAHGIVLGTAAYMSPEQARGLPVDKRTDIWAFGVVLYEMLTGARPFDGDTMSDTLAAVLTGDADLSRLPRGVPAEVRGLIGRCLQRDVKWRLRDMGEARITLSASPDPGPNGLATRAKPASSLQRRARLWIAVVLLVALAGLAPQWMRPRGDRTGQPLITVGIDSGGETPLAGVGWIGQHWVGPTSVLSPDGRQLAFIARGPAGGRWQLYVRRLDELQARPLIGTEGAYAPFFSPDGRSIGFFGGGRLMTVALGGGAVTAVCAAQDGRGATWTEDGTIVFAPRPEGPLYRVPAGGGTPEPATTLDRASGETSHRWPQALPGRAGLLFTATSGSTGSSTIVVWSASRRRALVQSGLFGRYLAGDYLLYLQDGKLFSAPFDLERLELTGPPVVVVESVAHTAINGSAQFSLSDNGLLVYRRARSPHRVLQWMDPSGQVQPIRGLPANYQELRFSDTGTHLLLVIADGAQSDVWVYDLARDTIARLTFHPDNDWSPIWSPDGRHVVYGSWRADVGTFNLFLQRTDGTGEPVRLTTSRNGQLPIEWHPGGQYVLFSEQRPGTGQDLMLLSLERTPTGDVRAGRAAPVLQSAANESAGEFSPDGRWLAYASDESGRSEVFVQPFPGPGGRWQVSVEGAEWIEWRTNDQLFYGRSEEVVMAVPYRVDGRTFAAGKPRIWLRIPPGVSWVDPAPDSTRAAVIRTEDTRGDSVVLMLNFLDHLRRLHSSGVRP